MEFPHCNPGRQKTRPGMARRVAMLSPLALLLVGLHVSAEVSEMLDYRYYSVQTGNATSLARALNRTSPIRQEGLIYHAYTTWQINWNFRWREDADGYCRITQVATGLNGIIQLPRLEDGTSNQRAQFARYLGALHEHELGHYQIGRKAALEIDRQLQAMPSMAECSKLAAIANRTAYRIVDQFKEQERTYDSITIHGRLQGARLDY